MLLRRLQQLITTLLTQLRQLLARLLLTAQSLTIAPLAIPAPAPQVPALLAPAAPAAPTVPTAVLILVVGHHTPAVAVATQLQAVALLQLMHVSAIHTFGVELLLLPALTVVAWSITASSATVQVPQEPLAVLFALLVTGMIP